MERRWCKLPVFIFLVFLGAAVLWLLLSFSYRTIGKLIAGILNDAKEAMKEEDDPKTKK